RSRDHLSRRWPAGIRFLEAQNVRHAVLGAQDLLYVVEEFAAFRFAVVQQPNRRPGERCQTFRRDDCRDSFFERRIKNTYCHCNSFLPSISMAFVTARPLEPNQGGMTAPNPPAGPPAATISRSLGSLIAVNSCVGPPPRSTMFVLPTFAQSERTTRAERNMYSRMSRFCQPAATSKSRSCFGMTRT